MNMLDGMQIDSKDRHGAVDTYDIDPRTLLTSDRARRSAANRLLEVYGYSNEIGEADLHDFLAAVLFGPGIKITGNRPIIGRLVELINRPVCVVRRLETDEGGNRSRMFQLRRTDFPDRFLLPALLCGSSRQ